MTAALIKLAALLNAGRLKSLAGYSSSIKAPNRFCGVEVTLETPIYPLEFEKKYA